jgi:cysteine desulfurase
MIYLDYAATTPPHPEVIHIVSKVMQEHWGNPSSLHHLGVQSHRLLQQARETAASLLKVKPSEVLFVSGGTESTNLAIKGHALRYQHRGKHLITTPIEHACVWEAFHQLEEIGFEVTYLPVDPEGRVALADLQSAVRPDTILVSIMHLNNEVGSVQPISEIGRWLRNHPKVQFHVDAIQSFGKVQLDIEGWGIDYLSLSAHKFHGPKGAGILFKREGLELQPLFSGGGQEHGVRSGTENLANIVGMVKAMRMANENLNEREDKLREFGSALRERLSPIQGIRIISPKGKNNAPHILNIAVPGIPGEALVHALEQEGYAVSTRSACSSKMAEPSRVLLAMGRSQPEAASSLRISWGTDTLIDHSEGFAQALERSVQRMLSVKGGKS